VSQLVGVTQRGVLPIQFTSPARAPIGSIASIAASDSIPTSTPTRGIPAPLLALVRFISRFVSRDFMVFADYRVILLFLTNYEKSGALLLVDNERDSKLFLLFIVGIQVRIPININIKRQLTLP
jgi:hypothetical protein